MEQDIESYLKNATEHGNLTSLEDATVDTIEDLPLALPSIDLSFNLDVPSIPQISLDFEFDGLEVYMDLDVSLDEKLTYDLNLYTSQTPLGIGLGTNEQLGITFTIDIVLSADGAIDIRNGFHLKFADGLGFNIALFDNTVAKLIQ